MNELKSKLLMISVFTGWFIAGVAAGGVAMLFVPPKPSVNSVLVTGATSLCQANGGLKSIDAARIQRSIYIVRCQNSALFENVTVKIEELKKEQP